MGCNAAENCMVLEINNCYKWLNCNMGKLSRIVSLAYPYRCTIEQVDILLRLIGNCYLEDEYHINS